MVRGLRATTLQLGLQDRQIGRCCGLGARVRVYELRSQVDGPGDECVCNDGGLSSIQR